MQENKKIKRRTKRENKAIIKQVTLELLEQKGYGNISTNEIAEKSDINISLLYRYFPNGKPEILKQLGNDFIKEIEERNIKDLKIDNRHDFLKDLITRSVKLHRERSTILQGLTIAFLSNKDLFLKEDLSLITMQDEIIELYTRIFKKLGYEKDDIFRKSRIIMHSIDTLIHRQVAFHQITENDEELIEDLTDLIMTYLNFN
ncbi:MAG: TetR/AcrR family transcriptional regulator [Promethearchaeota archaeon]